MNRHPDATSVDGLLAVGFGVPTGALHAVGAWLAAAAFTAAAGTPAVWWQVVLLRFVAHHVLPSYRPAVEPDAPSVKDWIVHTALFWGRVFVTLAAAYAGWLA